MKLCQSGYLKANERKFKEIFSKVAHILVYSSKVELHLRGGDTKLKKNRSKINFL